MNYGLMSVYVPADDFGHLNMLAERLFIALIVAKSIDKEDSRDVKELADFAYHAAVIFAQKTDDFNKDNLSEIDVCQKK